MRRLFSATVLAFFVAVLITFLSPSRRIEDQLLYLQVKQAAPEAADEFSDEPAALQALFLMYADDPILLLKARVAMLQYPDIAPPIFLRYGESEVFRGILRRYGEDVLLPIQYFLSNEIFTLELMRGLSETARYTLDSLRQRWRGESVKARDDSPLSSEERGWYAVHFIETEGYGFIGQFVMAPDGTVEWIQTERVLEAINQLFAGGIRRLETRIRREESIAAADVGWAAMDVAVGVTAFKLLRMGRAGAAGGHTLNFSQRSAAIGGGLWRGSLIGARMVKYGAPAVLLYMAVRHPSLIHSLLAEAAERLGLPTMWVQIVGWTILLLPIVLLLRLLIAPLIWVLYGLRHLLRSGRRTRYT